MWFTSVAFATSAPVTEEICVAAQRAAPAELSVPPPPAEVTAFRRAIASSGAPPDVPVAALLAAVPPDVSRELTVRAAAVPHPTDPDRAWLAVVGAAPPGGVTPVRLTLLIDTSESMESVPLRLLPPLQDAHPTDLYPAVSRLALGKAALHDLVDRLPPNASVSVVAFSRNRATRLLGPTSAERATTLHEAIERAGRVPTGGSILDVTSATALLHLDACADNRVLLVTDDNARLDHDETVVDRTVRDWRAQGIELWTLSLELLGRAAPDVARITAEGGGRHLRADSLSEATEQLAESLRAAGAVARDASIGVTIEPGQVRSWRRLDAPRELEDTDTWNLPTTLDAGWRKAAFYELDLVPGAQGPVATLSWSASSPVPDEWRRDHVVAVSVQPIEPAPAFVRDRAVAALLGEG
ncbi:MAG: VWA domain-containing protein, partial [Myxococcales bacterium]|nr:VWA domain-containing protein [Myxococcales bacterium]